MRVTTHEQYKNHTHNTGLYNSNLVTTHVEYNKFSHNIVLHVTVPQ